LLALKSWPGALAILSLFALNRSYDGIIGDAVLYVGRGLANLDPNGVGRDFLFREDGQSAFSIYPRIVERLIPHLGLDGTGMVLAGLGLLAWIGALAFLARELAVGRLRAAILVLVALLPFGYGAYGVFAFAEPLAVPRPFAEAAVLAGLAAFMGGRTLLALALMGVSVLFHPIMALAGIGVILLISSIEDRRWLFAGLALIALLAAAAAFGAPLLSRLYRVFDAQWWDILTTRHPYLFPSSWPSDAVAPLFVQATTIGIAASLARGRVRQVLWASIVVSLASLAVAILLGDVLRLVLVVQMQLWRPVWLLAALGAASLALCAGELWRRGGAFRLVFAVLVIAWAYRQAPAAALGACALALALFARASSGQPFGRLATLGAWLTVGVALLQYEAGAALALAGIFAGMPKDLHFHLQYLRCGELQLVPAAFLAAVSVNSERLRLRPGLAAVLGLALAATAIAAWDDRAQARKLVESGKAPAELARLVGNEEGEILWLPGRLDAARLEPWFAFHRPNWNSEIQGASILFSRPLALFWAERTRDLVDLGLLDPGVLTPNVAPPRNPSPPPTLRAIETLCARPDAPKVIISALAPRTALAAGIRGAVYRLPAPQFALATTDAGIAWQRFDAFAVMKCADMSGAKG